MAKFICKKCPNESPCVLEIDGPDDCEWLFECPFEFKEGNGADWKKFKEKDESVMAKDAVSCETCGNLNMNEDSECAECRVHSNWTPKEEIRPAATPEQMTWDEYFLKLAEIVSLKSKDESSKIGAVIVGPDHEIRSTGYNGFPRGFNDDDPIKQIRPMKYKYFEHAERNAIYNAARFGVPVKDCTIYCPWPPCSDCARAIIQAGIVKLVVSKPIIECPERWQHDMVIAADMLRECGVEFEVCDG